VAAEIGLGIDVGGTGVKAALVDLGTGELLTARLKLQTPEPATPQAVAATIGGVVERVAAEHEIPPDAPFGCGLPGVVKDGRLLTAANIDASWIGVNAEELLGQTLGRRVHAINDADAAGLAEMRFGACRGHTGTVLLLTLGTGIGSALFHGGRLVPNTELGHLETGGTDAETMLSGVSRERRGIGWPEWAAEFNVYLGQLELYLSPDLIVLGGGVSKAIDQYVSLLESRAPIRAAQFLNAAGVIGAALAAGERS
jgi:polyphosphate glucokinase